jgi:hypothetical protein
VEVRLGRLSVAAGSTPCAFQFEAHWQNWQNWAQNHCTPRNQLPDK